jgi:hypothetical protein
MNSVQSFLVSQAKKGRNRRPKGSHAEQVSGVELPQAWNEEENRSNKLGKEDKEAKKRQKSRNIDRAKRKCSSERPELIRKEQESGIIWKR